MELVFDNTDDFGDSFYDKEGIAVSRKTSKFGQVYT